jgi:hypothetical protein
MDSSRHSAHLGGHRIRFHRCSQQVCDDDAKADSPHDVGPLTLDTSHFERERNITDYIVRDHVIYPPASLYLLSNGSLSRHLSRFPATYGATSATYGATSATAVVCQMPGANISLSCGVLIVNVLLHIINPSRSLHHEAYPSISAGSVSLRSACSFHREA